MFEVPEFGSETAVRVRKSDIEGKTKPVIVEKAKAGKAKASDNKQKAVNN